MRPMRGDPWNMLATGFGNWPFFVLTQEMGAYLVGSCDEQFNYAAGETVVMQLPETQRVADLHAAYSTRRANSADRR